MAQRRMFSLKVIDTDLFLDMSHSAQLLYFHLVLRADDDGFVGNPKKIQRMIGAQDDDMKVLLGKQFVIPFENGVCVIRHWRVHNLIRQDRYSETEYIEEKEKLQLNNGKYERKDDVIPDGNQTAPQFRLGKDRLGKDRKENPATGVAGEEIPEVINSFNWNPAYKGWFNNMTQRKAAKRLLELESLSELQNLIKILPGINAQKYAPTVTTPKQLLDKWSSLEAFSKRQKSDKNKKVEWIT